MKELQFILVTNLLLIGYQQQLKNSHLRLFKMFLIISTQSMIAKILLKIGRVCTKLKNDLYYSIFLFEYIV